MNARRLDNFDIKFEEVNERLDEDHQFADKIRNDLDRAMIDIESLDVVMKMLLNLPTGSPLLFRMRGQKFFTDEFAKQRNKRYLNELQRAYDEERRQAPPAEAVVEAGVGREFFNECKRAYAEETLEAYSAEAVDEARDELHSLPGDGEFLNVQLERAHAVQRLEASSAEAVDETRNDLLFEPGAVIARRGRRGRCHS